jgi:hypothetical protein
MVLELKIHTPRKSEDFALKKKRKKKSEDFVYMGTSDPLKNIGDNPISEFQNNLKEIFACSKLLIQQTWKKSHSNLKFWATQKRQVSRFEFVHFKSINFIRFYCFYVTHNIKYLAIKFCILVGYIIDYVIIYSHSF